MYDSTTLEPRFLSITHIPFFLIISLTFFQNYDVSGVLFHTCLCVCTTYYTCHQGFCAPLFVKTVVIVRGIDQPPFHSERDREGEGETPNNQILLLVIVMLGFEPGLNEWHFLKITMISYLYPQSSIYIDFCTDNELLHPFKSYVFSLFAFLMS